MAVVVVCCAGASRYRTRYLLHPAAPRRPSNCTEALPTWCISTGHVPRTPYLVPSAGEIAASGEITKYSLLLDRGNFRVSSGGASRLGTCTLNGMCSEALLNLKRHLLLLNNKPFSFCLIAGLWATDSDLPCLSLCISWLLQRNPLPELSAPRGSP